jgi:hypothetical protein
MLGSPYGNSARSDLDKFLNCSQESGKAVGAVPGGIELNAKLLAFQLNFRKSVAVKPTSKAISRILF